MNMTHELDEVLKALDYLNNFSHEPEYEESCKILYEYLTDLVDLVKQSQDVAKKATEGYLKALGLINNREGRRALQKAGMPIPPK